MFFVFFSVCFLVGVDLFKLDDIGVDKDLDFNVFMVYGRKDFLWLGLLWKEVDCDKVLKMFCNIMFFGNVRRGLK